MALDKHGIGKSFFWFVENNYSFFVKEERALKTSAAQPG
jgi:hypothetical protein